MSNYNFFLFTDECLSGAKSVCLKRTSSLVSFKSYISSCILWLSRTKTTYKHWVDNMWRHFITYLFYSLIFRSKQYTLGSKYSAIWIERDKRLSGILPRLVFLYRGYSIYSVAKIKQGQLRTENHLWGLQQNKQTNKIYTELK